jgi:hypothetical protein
MCHPFAQPLVERTEKLCGGTGLKNRGINRWLPWVVAAMVLVSGCSGVLMESKDSSGKVERLKLDSGESWDSYDDRPRHPYVTTGKHGLDDLSIMLKSEKTF